MILALDLSTVSGWALSDGTCGTFDFTDFKHDYGCMGMALFRELGEIFVTHDIDLVIIEQPFMRGRTTYHLFGLVFTAHMVASTSDIPREMYTPQSIKKAVTGSIKATKDEVFSAVCALGYEPKNSHEADALAIIEKWRMDNE